MVHYVSVLFLTQQVPILSATRYRPENGVLLIMNLTRHSAEFQASLTNVSPECLQFSRKNSSTISGKFPGKPRIEGESGTSPHPSREQQLWREREGEKCSWNDEVFSSTVDRDEASISAAQ